MIKVWKLVEDTGIHCRLKFGDATSGYPSICEKEKDGLGYFLSNAELEAFAKECFKAGREQQQIIEYTDSGLSYVTGMMDVYPDFTDFWQQRKGSL